MKVEKFVDAASIDPIYYDASYYLAPDGTGSEDVYAVLREAIQRTGKVALTRVVMAQRERTIALRALDGGLAAHTLNEERDLNPAQPLFEGVSHVKLDPEMVALATQLVERQSEPYDPADLEDRYETRLRAMLDAKVKGEGVQVDAEPVSSESNVIDLMAALRRSLGQAAGPGGAAEDGPQARQEGAHPGRSAPAARPETAAAGRQESRGTSEGSPGLPPPPSLTPTQSSPSPKIAAPISSHRRDVTGRVEAEAESGRSRGSCRIGGR